MSTKLVICMGSFPCQLLGHDPTTGAVRSLRQWVANQGVHSLQDLLSWDPEELKSDPPQTGYGMNDQGELLCLRTNKIKHVTGLISYMRHILESSKSGPTLPDDPLQPFSPYDWITHTALHMRRYLVNKIPSPLGPNQVPPGPFLQQP